MSNIFILFILFSANVKFHIDVLKLVLCADEIMASDSKIQELQKALKVKTERVERVQDRMTSESMKTANHQTMTRLFNAWRAQAKEKKLARLNYDFRTIQQLRPEWFLGMLFIVWQRGEHKYILTSITNQIYN